MKPKLHPLVRPLLAALALCYLALPAAVAQWQSQTNTLKPGWNAVFLHVDPSYASIDDLVKVAGNPIQEIWLWTPPSDLQFVSSPSEPTVANSQWAVWSRASGVTNTLAKLIGNAAYLVNNTNSVPFDWKIKGRPVAPRYRWSVSGLNLIGFSTRPGDGPRFSDFLASVPEFRSTAELFQYRGGPLGANNPVGVAGSLGLANTFAKRGEAFWIRSSSPGYFNRYFGPVEVSLQNGSGVAFGDRLTKYSVRLKNATTKTNSITLALLASETAPTGQPAPLGTPPLLVRGAYNLTNNTYAATTLSAGGTTTVTLLPAGTSGSEVQVVLGLDRTTMGGTNGSFFAGTLRVTDGGGLSQIDVPVTASAASQTGLWVGDATITNVNQSLRSYQRDSDGQPVLGPVTATGAPYISTGTATGPGPVARPLPLRLIIHLDEALNPNLLQRVYYGKGSGSKTIIATQEGLLDPASIGSARRLSAAHLPFALTNSGWSGSRVANDNGSFRFSFSLAVDPNDHASNPFLHTFHPDHDNLKADFRTVEAPGVESYGVLRQIVIQPDPSAATDFASRSGGSDTLSGVYSETMTFKAKGASSFEYFLSGRVTLSKVSSISTLTTAP